VPFGQTPAAGDDGGKRKWWNLKHLDYPKCQINPAMNLNG
jgi:hypothetical protein